MTVGKLGLLIPAGFDMSGSDGPLDTHVSNLQLSGGTGGFHVRNEGDLTIGGAFCCSSGGASETTSGDIDVQTTGNLTVSNPVTTPAGAVTLKAGGTLTSTKAISGSSASLAADGMALGGGTVNAGTGPVALRAASAERPLDLGDTTDPADSLGLSDSELDTVTAGALTVGGSDGGLLTVTQAITPAHTQSLSLFGDGFAGPGYSGHAGPRLH